MNQYLKKLKLESNNKKSNIKSKNKTPLENYLFPNEVLFLLIPLSYFFMEAPLIEYILDE